MRIGRVHQRVVPKVPGQAVAASRADTRAHHEGAAALAAWATSAGIALLIVAASLLSA